MSLQTDEFLQHCEWNGGTEKCSELFKPKLTNHGICYTFNGMPAKDVYSRYYNERSQFTRKCYTIARLIIVTLLVTVPKY